MLNFTNFLTGLPLLPFRACVRPRADFAHVITLAVLFDKVSVGVCEGEVITPCPGRLPETNPLNEHAAPALVRPGAQNPVHGPHGGSAVAEGRGLRVIGELRGERVTRIAAEEINEETAVDGTRDVQLIYVRGNDFGDAVFRLRPR